MSDTESEMQRLVDVLRLAGGVQPVRAASEVRICDACAEGAPHGGSGKAEHAAVDGDGAILAVYCGRHAGEAADAGEAIVRIEDAVRATPLLCDECEDLSDCGRAIPGDGLAVGLFRTDADEFALCTFHLAKAQAEGPCDPVEGES